MTADFFAGQPYDRQPTTPGTGVPDPLSAAERAKIRHWLEQANNNADRASWCYVYGSRVLDALDRAERDNGATEYLAVELAWFEKQLDKCKANNDALIKENSTLRTEMNEMQHIIDFYQASYRNAATVLADRDKTDKP